MVLANVTGFPSSRRSRAGHTWSRADTLWRRLPEVKRVGVGSLYRDQRPFDPNVSHWFGSPLVSPRRSHSTRFADEPCVQDSGTV